MASKSDEDPEDGDKSVVEHLLENKNTEEKCVIGEEKDRDETFSLPENNQVVDGGTLQDVVEDTNLNEKMDSSRTLINNGENNDKAEEDKGESEDEETLTLEEKEGRKTKAQEFKEQGNDYFKRSEYPEAKEFYTNAVKICPNDFAKEKSVFHANRAACLVKMAQYKEAIEDCTKALDLNPDYMKVRLRRAQCYEHEDRLEEALEDYQKVFDADRSSHVAREALMRLPDQIRIKHEKMKEEMMGKLKELGNVFLRPFGLSTNNFKVQQDPNTGGYSVNFHK